jgi:uncharacterized repeat protein (TIGR03806 family)
MRAILYSSNYTFCIFYKLFSGILLWTCVPAVTFALPGLDTPEPVGAFLDGVFPSSTPGASPNATWTTQDAFPNFEFVEPVRIALHPAAEKLAIVEKGGFVWLIDNDLAATQKTLLLNLSAQLQLKEVGEGGIAGFVFHPEFGQAGSPNRGYFYVFYRWAPQPGIITNSNTPGYNRLSRFTVPDGSVSADPASEFIMIQQFDRAVGHAGGGMFFGSDGYLYITVGEEGITDKSLDTQRVDLGLFSGVLRIDVDRDPARSHAIRRMPQGTASQPTGWPISFSRGYYIPNDNPFVDPAGGNLEEFYAIGLRHPWTMDYDIASGNIWSGDVGAVDFEEVNIIEKGGNYQWAYMEGTITGGLPKPANLIGTEKPPLWEYDHGIGQAIIGAGVYRGSRYPELLGKFLFSDFIAGQLWTLELDEQSQPVVNQITTLPSGYPNGINSFALDRQGRILLAKTAGGLAPGGKILELVRQGMPTEQPPTLLSQTGIFADMQNLTIRSGCIPYGLNVPFWSDNALKKRWMCIPNDGVHDAPGEQIGFSEEGEWSFPIGAVLVKHFEMALSEMDPNVKRILETRFIVHATDGYYGVTYKWLPDGSDAELLYDGQDEQLVIDTASGPRIQMWHYPGRNECLNCHNANAGSVAGPKTRQLNGDIFYPATGLVANQLSTLNHLGIFSPAITEEEIPNFYTSVPTDDLSAGLDIRARSYLDSNCAYCHRPGGVNAGFDARLTTPLQLQNLINGPVTEPLGVPGEVIIAPGSLEQSVLYQRVASLGNIAMPPLAKNLLDEKGVTLLANWIIALGNGNQTPAINNPGFQLNNEGETIQLGMSAVDPDGDTVTFSALGLPPGLSIDVNSGLISGTLSNGSYGNYNVTVIVSDGIVSDNTSFSWTVNVPLSGAFMETVVVNNVNSDSWTRVFLNNSYTSLVAVCTVVFNNNAIPEVVRMRNIGSSSFELLLQNPSNDALVGEQVNCLVVEEGAWRLPDNRRLEAHRYTSTLTDTKNVWLGQVQSYNHTYNNPVVVGQVMTYNDTRWSAFWSRGGTRFDPPDAQVLYIGKHVGEDTDFMRNAELLGYIIFESGNGNVNGAEYEVAVGADTVLGLVQSGGKYYKFNQPFSSAPGFAVLSQVAMDSADGSWSVLLGGNPLNAGYMLLGGDQDQILDAERTQTTEQAAYIVFGSVLSLELGLP